MRLLISRTQGVGKGLSSRFFLNQLHPADPTLGGSSVLQYFRGLHSVSGGESFARHVDNWRSRPTCSRTVFTGSVPRSDLADESIASALNLDDRVPATVITGFLGSGKVFFHPFLFIRHPVFPSRRWF